MKRDAPIKIRRVKRLDCIALDTNDSTYFTEEGYLVDHPILTSCGIFEYTNPDGSIRRELRIPENVFSPESLKTYKGKPIIITHDAGVVTKENVDNEQIGTILSEGYQDGEDVRAEIIIHDTDKMKDCGLKELSLGYNLDLVEEPGEWNGEPYDAIQTNIVINHLALVASARAGEQARLNIDGSDEQILKGGKIMAKVSTSRIDGEEATLSPEELKKAIELYTASKAMFGTAEPTETDGDEETKAEPTTEPAPTPVAETTAQPDFQAETQVEPTVETKIEEKDAETQPAAPVSPKTEPAEKLPTENNPSSDLNSQVIAVLEKVIADLKGGAKEDCSAMDDETEPQIPTIQPTVPTEPVVEEKKEDSSDDLSQSMNNDSADTFKEKLAICRVGDKLNLDGLDSMSNLDGKKAVIGKVFPNIRLDGKDKAYVNAMYDLAVA